VLEVKVIWIQRMTGGYVVNGGLGRWYPKPNDPAGRGVFYFIRSSAPYDASQLVIDAPYGISCETAQKQRILIQNALYKGLNGPNDEYLEFTKA
jgi:hypothetical protein